MKYKNLSDFVDYKYTKFFNNIGKLHETYIFEDVTLLQLEVNFDCYGCYIVDTDYTGDKDVHPVFAMKDDCENICRIQLTEFDEQYKIWSVSAKGKNVYITVYREWNK